MKQTQDEKCARFEKDTEVILNHMDRHDASADADDVRFPFFVPFYLICVSRGLLINL